VVDVEMKGLVKGNKIILGSTTQTYLLLCVRLPIRELDASDFGAEGLHAQRDMDAASADQ
jgi:hypothetical protein